MTASFREMRVQLDDAIDMFKERVGADDDSEADEVVIATVTDVVRIAVLAFIQIAQELNEIKHSLNELTRQRKYPSTKEPS